MDLIVKQAWIDALESGEYRQGRRALHTDPGNGQPNEFCCLGVLCDMAYRAGVVPRVLEGGMYTYGVGDGEEVSSAELPLAVREWAGLEDSDPIVVSPYDHSPYDSLAYLNDNGLTFDIIAGIIREHL